VHPLLPTSRLPQSCRLRRYQPHRFRHAAAVVHCRRSVAVRVAA